MGDNKIKRAKSKIKVSNKLNNMRECKKNNNRNAKYIALKKISKYHRNTPYF